MTLQNVKKRKITQQIININPLTELQLAYIAGFADGDGSFIAQVTRSKTMTFKWQIKVSFTLTQKNKVPGYFEAFVSEIGMGVARPVRGKNSDVGDYTLNGFEALELFLPLLIPFLRLKKRQAELMLELIKNHKLINNDKERFFKVIELVDEISSLNNSKTKKNTLKLIKESFDVVPL